MISLSDLPEIDPSKPPTIREVLQNRQGRFGNKIYVAWARTQYRRNRRGQALLDLEGKPLKVQETYWAPRNPKPLT